MTTAYHVRKSLAASKREGLPFREAWAKATAGLPPPARTTTLGPALEPGLWALAILWAHSAFRDAYEDRPASPAVAALGRLDGALVAEGMALPPDERVALVA